MIRKSKDEKELWKDHIQVTFEKYAETNEGRKRESSKIHDSLFSTEQVEMFSNYKPTILQMHYLWPNLHLSYDDDCN